MAGAELPPRCIEFCPVINGVKVAEYPLALSRNCQGPNIVDGEITDHVRLHKDGTTFVVHKSLNIETTDGSTREIVFIESASCESACTNRGINNSIEYLISATEQ